MAIGIGKGGELSVVLRVKDDGSVTVEKFGRTAEKSMKKGARAAKAMSAAYVGATGNLSKLTRSVFSFKTAIAGIGIGAVSRQFIDAASTSEQFRVRLSVLLGSVDEGNRLFKEMATLASQLPFEYEDVMASATQLSGILEGGVDEISQWMPLIADLAATAGLGIQQTTDQVAKMLSAGANSADLFQQRGILSMLGFQAGVQISAEETKAQLVAAWTDTDSRFRGATDKLKRTWEGTMSTLSDKWFLVRNQIMDAGLFDFFKAAARVIDDDLGGALENNEAAAKRWADTVINAIETMAIGTAKFVDVVGGPIDDISRIGSDLWAEYQRLPQWAQEIGIVGALLGGRKGLIVVAGLTAAGDEMRTTAEWWKAFSQDQVGFFEWLTSGSEAAREKLDALQKRTELMSGTIQRDVKPLADILLGDDAGGGESAESRIRNFFTRIREEMEASRAELAASAANAPGSEGGSFILGNAEEDLRKLREALSEKLIALDDSMLSERELLQNDFLEKQFLLEEALDTNAQSYQAYNERRAALDTWYTNQKAKLDTKDLKRQSGVEASVRSMRQATFTNTVALLNVLATKSKTAALLALVVQKGLAIAQTIVNTKVAQIRAMAELGPIAGPPMAAAIGAWGAASIALIAATGLVQASGIAGGGGPEASPVFQADPGTNNPVTNDAIAGPDQRQQPPERTVFIVLDSDRLITTNMVRDQIIPEINEAVGDGVIVKVSA